MLTSGKSDVTVAVAAPAVALEFARTASSEKRDDLPERQEGGGVCTSFVGPQTEKVICARVLLVQKGQ